MDDTFLPVGDMYTLSRIVGKIIGRQREEPVRQVQHAGHGTRRVLIVAAGNTKGIGLDIDATAGEHAQDGARVEPARQQYAERRRSARLAQNGGAGGIHQGVKIVYFVVVFVLVRILEVDIARLGERAALKAQDRARQQQVHAAKERLVTVEMLARYQFSNGCRVDDPRQPRRLRRHPRPEPNTSRLPACA